ncbi:MAG: leucine-rich repeat protein, partial [Clostridia bacterium]|nr:leucine-rich repeat protein [Clostridia bacterium]
MKSLKRLLCLMLTFVIVAGIIPTVNADTIIFAKNYTSSDGKWIYSRKDTDDEAWLYRYLGNETDVVIPEEIDGFKIITILSRCFYGREEYDTVNVENNDRIKSIKIPSTIKRIDLEAFAYMDSLEDIIFDEHMNGIYLNSSLFESSPLLHRLRIPGYCTQDFSSFFLSNSSIKELEIPYVNISSYSGSDHYAFNLNPVENLIITGDYEFGEHKGFFSTNSIKTVEVKGFVTGDNVTYDFYDIRDILRNKPDFIFHNSPSATVDVGLQEFGYVKSYDAETGFTMYSVNGIPDTAYSPVINNNGAVDELQSGDFSYTLTDSENAIILGYSGNDNAVDFPSEIDSHTVIAIGADGFT